MPQYRAESDEAESGCVCGGDRLLRAVETQRNSRYQRGRSGPRSFRKIQTAGDYY